MPGGRETLEDRAGGRAAEPPLPGVVVCFTGHSPVLRILWFRDGRLLVGREALGDLPPDETVSRAHAEITVTGAGWQVRDLGSRNGTFVDGARVRGEVRGSGRAILRVGHTVLMLEPNARPLVGMTVTETPDVVVGPRLRPLLERASAAAATVDTLLIFGESGSGKELVARAYHGGSGPFVAVNCATIPEPLAERLLFGTVRGAYSGATADRDGYLVAAHGGTLFLDEVGELDARVQAKLLRALETREVMPLGAPKVRPVAVRVCAATHRDLRGDVAAGRVREDLYFRLAHFELRLPPLRDRVEEIPWLLARALGAVREGLRPDGHFVEACCLRPWPGNVRELLTSARRAAAAALATGEDRVTAQHLEPMAGRQIQLESAPGPTRAEGSPAGTRAPARPLTEVTRAEVEEALARHDGNVTGAARALGLHRTQLRRILARLGERAGGK